MKDLNPFKHLNGARAMAMHVSEGGKVYDDFGKHITGLSRRIIQVKEIPKVTWVGQV